MSGPDHNTAGLKNPVVQLFNGGTDMNIQVKAVHFDLSEKNHEFIDKKLKRIEYADDFIVDLLMTFTHEKNSFKAESTINFRWGSSAHLKVESHDLYEAVNVLTDKMEHKITKEKDRIQEHKGSGPVPVVEED